jgi:hypothetical protein
MRLYPLSKSYGAAAGLPGAGLNRGASGAELGCGIANHAGIIFDLKQKKLIAPYNSRNAVFLAQI